MHKSYTWKIENCVISSYCPPKSHFQPRGAVAGVLNQRSSDQTKENQAIQDLVFCMRPLPSDWAEGFVHRNRASDGGSLAGQGLCVCPSNSFHDCSFIPVLDFGSYWNIGGKITCEERF